MMLQLSSGQKRLYDLLYSEMSKGRYSINLPLSFPKNSVNVLVKLVLGEHPELINYDNCTVNFIGLGPINAIRLNPVFSDRELHAAQLRFDQEVQRILQQIIKPKATPIQRVLAIHDYLVNNVVYDEDDSSGRKRSLLSHTAYGAIVEKKAVCEGIAYAFSLLANKAGIETTVVNGIAGEQHAWNMIRMDSDCYHIDVTWDIRKRTNPNMKAYDYFCLSDRDLQNRKWDRKIYPVCDSVRYHYFNVTKTFAHSKQQLREIILRQYPKYKALYLKYDFLPMGGNEAADYIWNELVSVARENGWNVGEVMYSLNDDQRTFMLYGR